MLQSGQIWTTDINVAVVLTNLYNIQFQLDAIRAKYVELENSYRYSRDETKQTLSNYKEEADIKLLQLHDKFLSLRSEISN